MEKNKHCEMHSLNKLRETFLILHGRGTVVELEESSCGSLAAFVGDLSSLVVRKQDCFLL